MKTTTVNGKIRSLCPRCDKYKPSHSQNGLYFEGGITIKFLGGYAEYYDPMFDEGTFSDKAVVELTLCHECTVEVLKFAGVYEDERFRGGHPSDKDSEPCCDNCWMPIYDDGKWVGIKDPQGNITMHKPVDPWGHYKENKE